jgi:uncharacterized repeat protein (TIGR01451 family)
VIALAILILSACRGLDPNGGTAQYDQAAAPSNAIADESRAPSAITADTAPVAAHPLTRPPQATQRSLSDNDHSVPTASSGTIMPAQHTVTAEHQTPTEAGRPSSVTTLGAIPRSDVPQTLVTASPYPAPAYPQPCPPVYPQPCFPTEADSSCGACQPAPWCPPGVPCAGWRPPGLPCPWPEDEYLCDGGDQIPSVRVRNDWSVDGLQLEDTVVHYDTLNGDTHVQPSNRVCIYAPRFASVRKVYGVLQHERWDQAAKLDQPVTIDGLDDTQFTTTAVQPVPPVLRHGLAGPSGFRDQLPPTGLDNLEGLVGTQGSVIPYEDFTDVQRAMLSNTEKARLAALVEAAAVWSHDVAVQVVIDNIATHEDVATTAAESVHIYSLEGKPRLRVCKMASRQEARPGETVEFTLLFENVGDQTIGNVTVIDNLTTRLEYVPDSQNCSLSANFSSSENQGESLALRWEIIEPMKVGQSGIIRFTCRVR